jgi:hypothetical protein
VRNDFVTSPRTSSRCDRDAPVSTVKLVVAITMPSSSASMRLR